VLAQGSLLSIIAPLKSRLKFVVALSNDGDDLGSNRLVDLRI